MSDPFSVVRQAHRICAAYYQQMLPLINETAYRLGAEFFRRDHWSFSHRRSVTATLLPAGSGIFCRYWMPPSFSLTSRPPAKWGARISLLISAW